jgi:radical SAM protein with 4Fe4S-binding SPASM domain
VKYFLAYYFRLLRVIDLQKIKNLILIYGSYYFNLIFRRNIHRGEPWSLSIETGTFCNLSCLECPSGQKQFLRPTGVLSLENFKTIIQKQKRNLIWLILYFQGEPFLNKEFFKMVAHARSQKIFTSTSTNGHFLTPKKAEETVKSGLDRIIISLDGLDQQTYEQYRVGGNFNQVMNGIKNLVDARKRLKASNPLIVVQFIVFKFNESQISKAKALKSELGVDKVELKTAQIYSATDDNKLIPNNSKYTRYSQTTEGLWKIKKPVPNHCNRMWRAAVVTWDGNVVPCCFDKDAKYVMGNLLTESFSEIKNTTTYKNFRNQVFTDRAKIEICKNCSEGL